MYRVVKQQRIRDPLHNLIEFEADQFAGVMWGAVQTRPFQRLRRIKQLGFSELVYPGATHTRFAHSIGVFHIARQLLTLIRRHLGESNYDEHQGKLALAAALVHDLGHGMFSHAFEDVGRKLGLKLAHHETVSDELIRGNDIKNAFHNLGRSFADEVADVIKRKGPNTLYDAIVSSQFDADRLDYMQRDRLMAGLQNNGIDFTWLLANLQVASIPIGVDDSPLGEMETFVLGPKALHAAETYVLSLFQLYPNVYFHKTTRGAEKVFSALMVRIVELVRDSMVEKTGLDTKHPIVQFAKDPEKVERVLDLDDTVFWGALPMLANSSDLLIKNFSLRLRDRLRLKCIDVRQELGRRLAIGNGRDAKHDESRDSGRRLLRALTGVKGKIENWERLQGDTGPRLIIDEAERDPYKAFSESKGALNQIHIVTASGEVRDLSECSPAVKALETFELYRVYFDESDDEAKRFVHQVMDEAAKEENGDARSE